MNEDHSRGRKRDHNGELRCPSDINGPSAPPDGDNPQATRTSKKRAHEQSTGFVGNNDTIPNSTGRKRQRPPRRNRRLRQPTLDFGPGQLNIPANAIRPDKVYGDGVEPKLDGTFRLAYGNIDGFSTVAYNNPKANVLKHWLRTIEADFFAGNEAQINWKLMPRSGCLHELFRTENALRAVAGYNTHENFSRRQYGGTFQLTFGSLAARVVDTGVDDRGLGRYAWTKFQGRNGHVARIV
jgi:hypothetical protein